MSKNGKDDQEILTPLEDIGDLDVRNWQALHLHLQFQEKRIQELQAMIKALNNNVGTLKLQFDQFQEQRIKELRAKIGTGPTA